MSKLEIVRNLRSTETEQQIQIVRAVRELQDSLIVFPQILRDEIRALGIGREIAESLKPLDNWSKTIEAQQTAVAVTLDEASKRMAEASRELARISQLTVKIEGVARCIEEEGRALSQQIDKASKGAVARIHQATEQSSNAIKQSQPGWWRQWGLVLAGGVAAALLVLGGQSALDDLRSIKVNRELEQKAQTLDAVWYKATAKEREQIERILRR